MRSWIEHGFAYLFDLEFLVQQSFSLPCASFHSRDLDLNLDLDGFASPIKTTTMTMKSMKGYDRIAC
jgi:hypothetical protein